MPLVVGLGGAFSKKSRLNTMPKALTPMAVSHVLPLLSNLSQSGLLQDPHILVL